MHQHHAPLRTHVHRWSSACLLAALVSACQPTGPMDADELNAVANLVQSGDYTNALTALRARPTPDLPLYQRLVVEALTRDQQFEQAAVELASLPDGPYLEPLRRDLCLRGARAAGDDPQLLLTRILPCADDSRVDFQAWRILANILPLPAVDAVAEGYPDRGMVARPSPVDAMPTYELARSVSELPPSEHVDVARQVLERIYLATSIRVPDPVLRLLARRDAYLVRNTPEIGSGLLEELETTADQLRATDPQGAASLYEVLIFGTVGELPIPDDVLARVRQKTRDTLFPIFMTNFEDRYLSKHLEDDVAAGILTADERIARFGPVSDLAERRAQLAAWIYRVNERPTPVPTPDFAALIPGCSDPAATCAVDFTTLSTLIYNVDATEAALAASLGRPLDYQPALEP